MKSQFLHFDSSTSNYILDTKNTSGNTKNCYKSQYLCNQSFSNIKRVHLKSVELPYGFTNIRTGSTDILQFILNGTSYSVSLNEKNYTNISNLLTDINAACLSKVTNIILTFGLTSSLINPNRLIITFSGSILTNSFSIIDTNLSKYILGFRSSTDTLVGYQYSASYSNYNLNFDNYINMYIPTFNCMSANQGGLFSTFKIPLNSATGQIYYYFDNNSFHQHVDITNEKMILSNMIVIFYDKFGNNLNPNGLDVSFTLLLEFY